MLLVWALVLLGVLIVGVCAVRTAKELEQQAGEENQDTHRLAA